MRAKASSSTSAVYWLSSPDTPPASSSRTARSRVFCVHCQASPWLLRKACSTISVRGAGFVDPAHLAQQWRDVGEALLGEVAAHLGFRVDAGQHRRTSLSTMLSPITAELLDCSAETRLTSPSRAPMKSTRREVGANCSSLPCQRSTWPRLSWRTTWRTKPGRVKASVSRPTWRPGAGAPGPVARARRCPPGARRRKPAATGSARGARRRGFPPRPARRARPPRRRARHRAGAPRPRRRRRTSGAWAGRPAGIRAPGCRRRRAQQLLQVVLDDQGGQLGQPVHGGTCQVGICASSASRNQ